MTYSCTNPFWSTEGGDAIDVLWDHPDFGEIPFTATPHDVESYGREIFNEAVAEAYGPVVSFMDSHWYSTVNNNQWNGETYNIGDLMISPTGVQPPNSTQTPPPQF